MDKFENYFRYLVAAIGTGITWLFGTWDIAIITLTIFVGLDYFLGVLRAFINKEVSSSIGAKGIAKKAVIFIVLIVSVLLDRLLNTGSWVFRTLVAYFYICNEGISILENGASLGVPMPPRLKEVLLQLKEGEKKEIKEAK